jgi:hypothetical protein
MIVHFSKKDLSELFKYGSVVAYERQSCLPGTLIKIYHKNRFRFGMILGNIDNQVIVLCVS